MNNIAILAMFIAVEATIILTLVLVVGALIRMSKQIENINNVYYNSFKALTDAYNGLRDIDDSREEVYKKIIEADEKMSDAYKKGIEIDKEILNAWRDIEETYSATYEEYRHCIEKLEGLDKANADIYAKLKHIEECVDIFNVDSVEDIYWDPDAIIPFGEEEPNEQKSDET